MKKVIYGVLVLVVTVPVLAGITMAAPTKVMENSLLPQQSSLIAATQPSMIIHKTTDQSVSKQKPDTHNVPAKSSTKAQAPIKKSTSTGTRTIQHVVSRTTKSTSSSSDAGSKATGIIISAKRLIGVRYVWGGTTPAGFDCSGFVQYVFAHNGISLPRNSRAQFATGQAVKFSALRPGDLIFFSLASNGVVDHVGIYLGGGQFINASTSKGVTIYSIGPYWKSHFIGARRVL